MNRWDRVPQNKKELVSAMKNDMFDPISSIYHVLLLSKGNGIEADEHIQVDATASSSLCPLQKSSRNCSLP